MPLGVSRPAKTRSGCAQQLVHQRLIWGHSAPAIAFLGVCRAGAWGVACRRELRGVVRVMLGAVVIDDKGEAWPLGSPGLRERLSCTDPNLDFVSYAVHNLGFVVLRRH